MPRWDARSDTNQQEIIDALRLAGCSVLDLHRVGQGCPDLLVGKNGRNYLLEVKQEKRDLTVPEIDFFLTWKGQKTIIRTPAQAVEYILDDQEGNGVD